MVEFVLVIPALLLILLAIMQLGIVFKNYVTLTRTPSAPARARPPQSRAAIRVRSASLRPP